MKKTTIMFLIIFAAAAVAGARVSFSGEEGQEPMAGSDTGGQQNLPPFLLQSEEEGPGMEAPAGNMEDESGKSEEELEKERAAWLKTLEGLRAEMNEEEENKTGKASEQGMNP